MQYIKNNFVYLHKELITNNYLYEKRKKRN